jgi:hypothetical protein
MVRRKEIEKKERPSCRRRIGGFGGGERNKKYLTTTLKIAIP